VGGRRAAGGDAEVLEGAALLELIVSVEEGHLEVAPYERREEGVVAQPDLAGADSPKRRAIGRGRRLPRARGSGSRLAPARSSGERIGAGVGHGGRRILPAPDRTGPERESDRTAGILRLSAERRRRDWERPSDAIDP